MDGQSRRLDGSAHEGSGRNAARSNGGESDSSARKKRANGSTPTRAALFIGGPLDLPISVPSAVQRASTALVR
jgi:hypothetical protein